MNKLGNALYEIHHMDMLAAKGPVGEQDSSTG